jgi:hypothetical protein
MLQLILFDSVLFMPLAWRYVIPLVPWFVDKPGTGLAEAVMAGEPSGQSANLGLVK